MTTGTVTAFPLNPLAVTTQPLFSGPDGNLWIQVRVDADSSHTKGLNKLERIAPDGTITTLPADGSSLPILNQPIGGSDGNLWFLSETNDPSKFAISSMTTDGVLTSFPIPRADGQPTNLPFTLGPDGNVWFLTWSGSKSFLNSITPDGAITNHTLPAGVGGSWNGTVQVGPDGTMWITGGTLAAVTINDDGSLSTVTAPGDFINPQSIAIDGNGNAWFTANNPSGLHNELDVITPSGKLTNVPLPAQTDASTLTAGGDGSIWASVVASGQPEILHVNSDNSVAFYPLPTPGAIGEGPMTLGWDNQLWFIEQVSLDRGGTGYNLDSVASDGTFSVHPLNPQVAVTSLTLGADGSFWFLVNPSSESPNPIFVDRISVDLPPILYSPGGLPIDLTAGTGITTSKAAPVTVGSVARQGIGRHPTTLNLTFSASLDPSTATDPRNYTILLVGPRGHSRPHARPITITAASYNATTHTVTLTPKHRLKLSSYYRLTVQGASPSGVHGDGGTPLAGAAQSGTNFVTIIHRFGVVTPKLGRSHKAATTHTLHKSR